MGNFSFKVVWLKYSIGISVNKKLKNNYQVPITSFYFWPRVDGWKLLKNDLELKPWLTKNERIQILNSYTKIISIWKESINEFIFME